MPSSSSARITRTAISPRLATSTYSNIGRGMVSGAVRVGLCTPNEEGVMRRLCIGIAVVVMGVLLMPGVADSAAKKKRAVDITVKAAVVDSANGVNTVAGALSGKPFGSGAVVYKSRSSGSDVAATYKAFYAKGTLRGTSLLTPTPQPD